MLLEFNATFHQRGEGRGTTSTHSTKASARRARVLGAFPLQSLKGTNWTAQAQAELFAAQREQWSVSLGSDCPPFFSGALKAATQFFATCGRTRLRDSPMLHFHVATRPLRQTKLRNRNQPLPIRR
jgi:hypothetical protein